jgi:hypothetical protein
VAGCPAKFAGAAGLAAYGAPNIHRKLNECDHASGEAALELAVEVSETAMAAQTID